MRKYIVSLFLLFCVSFVFVFSQDKEKESSCSGVEISRNIKVEVDTTLKVEYNLEKGNYKGLPPAYFVNGEFISNMKFLKPENIKGIDLQHDTILIEGQKHYGYINFITKEGCQIKPISLSDLKAKYTNLGEAKALYFVDDKFIEENYDNYLVNEPDLMRIYIEKCRNPEIAAYIIRILTNTEENVYNLKNPNIMIRGDEK
mgnify:FL=1